MRLPSVFSRYRASLEEEMRAVCCGQELPLYQMLRYHLGWVDPEGRAQPSSGGKALRPTLCLLACEATEGDPAQALPAACAIELIHNFSLIHDDIQDGDRERRHRPTVWSLWGKPHALNAGTAMRVLANLGLLRLRERGILPSKQLQAQRLLEENCLRMIEGQCLDISYEGRLDVSVAEYLDMVERKTGALISCALQLGALLGPRDDRTVQGFGEMGRNLGIAFQIQDDILGIWGKEERTGKPLANDIRRRKKSLPLIYALERAWGEQRKAFLEVYRRESRGEEEVEMILEVLGGLEAQAYTQQKAQEYCQAALEEMKRLDITADSRRELEEVAVFLVERDF